MLGRRSATPCRVERWRGALHLMNALLILGMYGWLLLTLRKDGPEVVTVTAAASSG
jgi:hypothetical protein